MARRESRHDGYVRNRDDPFAPARDRARQPVPERMVRMRRALVADGAVCKKLVVVPYGRIQLVDVSTGPIGRSFGLVSVELHAAAASNAKVCGLDPDDAEALRDRPTALGEVHAAGP